MTSCRPPYDQPLGSLEARARSNATRLQNMASIPNLNTFHTRGRASRLRRHRGGRTVDNGVDPDNEENIEASRDRIVQQTDHDASSSRMSAVTLGYMEDPFANAFFPSDQQISRRYPIINRGTYVRTKAIDRLVLRFLDNEPTQRKQVVSLGAGSDTRFFRLCAEQKNVVYHELDFESNVIPKRTVIRSSPELSRLAMANETGSAFYLHALDLRDLTAKSPPPIPNLEIDLPTLIISECCLCYLPSDSAISVIQYFTMNIKASLGIILYEPIRPFDAFGKTMVTNLASRGIHLHTLKRYCSLDAQRQRLRISGLSQGQGARDVYQLWNDDEWVSPLERERIEKLEWLDEIEEWQLLASHYSVVWGWRGDAFLKAWVDIAGSRTDAENADDEMM